MPYTGPQDPKLPNYVKEKPTAARRQWVGAWNGAFRKCVRDGGGTQFCEGQAFRIANATLKGNKTMPAFICKIHPETASLLSIEGYEAPEDLHLTLCVLPNFVSQRTQEVINVAQELAYMVPPIKGRINGLGRFVNVSDGTDAIVALPDLPDLPEFRETLASTLRMIGIEVSKSHGYIPHITLAYIDNKAPSPIDRIQDYNMGLFDFELSFKPEEGGLKFSFPFMGLAENVFAPMDNGFSPVPDIAMRAVNKATKQPPPMTGDNAKSVILAEGNNLKTININDKEWRAANYIVLFGGRDIYGAGVFNTPIRPNADGSTGEFFTKSTNFNSPFTETDTLMVDWEHGMRPDGLGPGEGEPVGRVDWKTAQQDEVGIFVERVFNRQNKYLEGLRLAAEAGLIKLGNSTEAVKGMIKKETNGRISQWGLKADTLTVTPMEPRMVMENSFDVKGVVTLPPENSEPVLDWLKSVLAKSLETNQEGPAGAGQVSDRDVENDRLRLKSKSLIL